MEDHKIVRVFANMNGESSSKFHIDELIRALYIGYEVEPEFKAGELAVLEIDGKIRVIGEIVEIVESDKAKVDDQRYPVPQLIHVSKLRHSTPSEFSIEKTRRWWEKHGREPWELRDRDLLIDIGVGEICTVWTEHDDLHLTTKGHVVLSIYNTTDLEGGYEVLCFAEDRKDINATS